MTRTIRYQQIATDLRGRIAELGGGRLLPSESDLSAEFAASRVTVRRALELLRDEGLVESRQGFGWIVSGEPLRQQLSELVTIEGELEAKGFEPSRQILEFAFETATKRVRAILGTDQVLRVRRLNLADGAPFAVVTVWCPAELGQHLSRRAVEHRPFYELLGIQPARCDTDHRRRRRGGRRRRTARTCRRARRCCAASGSPPTPPAVPCCSASICSRHTAPSSSSSCRRPPRRSPRQGCASSSRRSHGRSVVVWQHDRRVRLRAPRRSAAPPPPPPWRRDARRRPARAELRAARHRRPRTARRRLRRGRRTGRFRRGYVGYGQVGGAVKAPSGLRTATIVLFWVQTALTLRPRPRRLQPR